MQLTLTAERYGFKQGMQQGEAQLLIKQLKAKFHALPSHYLDRVHQADIETLSGWAINIIHAQTLSEVFGE